MRQQLWSFAIAGLAIGSLAMVGGTAIGGEMGPLAIGYGLLLALSALYLVIGLAVRERVWRREQRSLPRSAQPDRLAGRRVF